jgi:multiple sugar transport system substrate-binding protein
VTRVEVWAHAGQATERATLEAQALRFNGLQDSIRVEIAFIPEGSYNAQVQASAVAGGLPDLLEIDGPYVAQYAWQGRLRPLGPLLGAGVGEVLPSIVEQGTWRDVLYAVGTFDSGLGLYASASALEAVGARIPRQPEDAWTVADLAGVLSALGDADPDGAVLDLKLNYDGEWFTYAFQPALRSAGGGLLERAEGRPTASGVLDGPHSRHALEVVQSWIGSGLVDPNLDDRAFVDGRVALSWSGHWDFPRYQAALGEDLVVLPLPDFGEGTRTGQGSWMWGIPVGASQPEAAATFLQFLLRREEVLRMADANGAVPGTRSAARASERYGPGGPLHLLLRQLEGGWSVPRPRTPAYPFASSVFQDVFGAVRNGEPLAPLLEAAAGAIDREVDDNRGYPES